MARKKEKVSLKKAKRRVTPADIFIRLGISLVAAGLVILFLTFGPVALQEFKYAFRQLFGPKMTTQRATEIQPIDGDFGIIIPKLGANARVVPNVDPYNPRAYQVALTKGVAHARGTSVPGAMGNMFLFAHSSEDFYNAVRYNSIFYLLTKLEAGDEIIMYYKDVKFTYVVTDKTLVSGNDVSYLDIKGESQTLTLMTCWPPGTTLKRLLVFAQLKK